MEGIFRLRRLGKVYISTDTACCAMGEIGDLNLHKTPEDAMKAFCKQFTDYYSKSELHDIGAFYIFSGVVRCQEGNADGCRCSNHDYAPKFAEYIKERGLGIVKESPGRRNRVNHPYHTVKLWIWAPSVKALQTWWKEHGGK